MIILSNGIKKRVKTIRKHTCKDCLYLCPKYGIKNKQGKRTISNYFCSCSNCGRTLTKCPSKCQYKVRKEKVSNK